MQIIDFYDDCAIAWMYSYLDGKTTLNRIRYTIEENGEVTLGDVNEVHVVYEDLPSTTDLGVEVKEAEELTEEVEQLELIEAEVTEVEDETETKLEAKEVELQTVITDQVTNEESTPEVTEESFSKDVAPDDHETAENAALEAHAEVTTKIEEVGAMNEQKEEEENSGSAALTESERAEFEALKKERKEHLINSYKEFLSEEEHKGFVANLDSTSYEELEANLSKIKLEKEKQKAASRKFSLSALLPKGEKKKSLGALVNYYL